MSTYNTPSFKHETMKQSSSPESPIPVENLIMYIPNSGGIHDSDVPRVGGNGSGLLRDCRSHEMLSIGQTESRIPPSGFSFHSGHVRCDNILVGFPSLVYENMQDSKSYLQGIGNVVSDSKYLKPTQNLLDDVVNVKKAMKQHSMNNSKEAFTEWKYKRDSIPISASEKKDLHKKMTKLSSMLNEVDRKYNEYYNEMEIVISSFDGVAGYGAAIPYTTLTLQTISRKFRFLKDAIKTQIQVMSRRLGNTDSNGDGIGIPRLKFVDQQSRVQHIWRPQRGLPECSVSVLRAWLFEHFLHPYPKDSEKVMLARQTGLTRSQVANWFINARVRLWKPMIEEMYKEESTKDSNSSSEIPPT